MAEEGIVEGSVVYEMRKIEKKKCERRGLDEKDNAPWLMYKKKVYGQ